MKKRWLNSADFAVSAGADEIGFTPVPQEWVFKDTAIRYTRAIVLVMEMDKDAHEPGSQPGYRCNGA